MYVFKQSSRRSVDRQGLTLTELLVVITILMVLLGVVLPLVSPSVKSRKMREAARQVNTVFTSAKSRAEGTQQPAGVILNINPNEPERVFSLAFAKAPAFFSGSDDGSQATVNSSSFQLTLSNALDGSEDTASPIQLQRLLELDVYPARPFLIRLNHRGRWFNGLAATDGTAVTMRILPNGRSARALLQEGVLNNVPYQIMLPPKQSAAGGIELPVGTHIDLERSWIAVNGVEQTFGVMMGIEPTNAEAGGEAGEDETQGTPQQVPPLAMMFDSENGLGYVYHANLIGKVVGPAALLIVDSDIEQDQALAPESGSMWVTVNNRTGQVKTSENLGHVFADDGITIVKRASKAALDSPKAGGR